MGTRAKTIDHLLDALVPLALTAGQMFGEYALFLDGKVVALVCEDQLFLKPTPGAWPPCRARSSRTTLSRREAASPSNRCAG